MAEALAIGSLSALAAALPTAAYVGLLWWLDPFEKEPVPLLLGAFLWGAVPAVILALIAELVAGAPAQGLGEPVSAILDLGLIAPLLEEAAKGGALLVLLLAFHGEFDDVLDGIVYGAMVGFGFAMTENLFYFVGAYVTGGLPQWGMVVFLRAAVFGLNHALFTSVTGAGMGLARLSRNGLRQIALPFGAFTLAVMLHSIHNVFAQLNDVVCGAVLLGAMSDWLGVLVMLLVVWATWRRERSWIAQELGEELAIGTVTHEEYHAAQSAWQRLVLRWQAWSNEGWSAGSRVARFYQSITELAFKKSQARLLGADPSVDVELRELRQRIAASRPRGMKGQ